MRRLLSAVVVCCLLGAIAVGVAPSAGATTFTVTSGDDSGPGTFVAAMDAATADDTGPHIIEFTPGLTVEKDSTDAYYFGTQPLTINGNRSTITGLGDSSRLLTIATSAAVVINDLTLTATKAAATPEPAYNSTASPTPTTSPARSHARSARPCTGTAARSPAPPSASHPNRG